VISPDVACPEVELAIAGTAADFDFVEPLVVSLVVIADVGSGVAEPVDVFVADASLVGVAEPRAFVDIALVVDVLVAVSVVWIEVDIFGRPRFLSFPTK